MDQTTCAGCDAKIVQSPRARNPRKWCSEACLARHRRLNDPNYRKRQLELGRERAARISAAKPPRPLCLNCGAPIRRSSLFCSRAECKPARRRYEKEHAPECSESGCDRPAIGRGLCGSHYAAVWRAENPDKSAAGKQRYRARKRDAWVEDVDRSAVLERDGWRCGICGKRIPKHAKYPDPESASIDHVVPLSKGGTHEMKNV